MRGGVGWGVISVDGPLVSKSKIFLLIFYFEPRILALRARALYREIKDEIMEIKEIKEINQINAINQ